MKIFYAIQATGNGHIARAMELMPYLTQYGEVDVFLSGSNSNLAFDLPVKYRSKGVSLFYGNRGGLDYKKMVKAFNPIRIWSEAKQLPIEKYDVVINDFESITSLACRLKNIPSVNFGHQASFQSAKTPRPQRKDFAGELVLKNYAPASAYIGLHFEQYDNFIFSPVIKEDILKAAPLNKGHITVYLSHYADELIARGLKKIKDMRFEIFSKTIKEKMTDGNITFVPVSNKPFNESMINCHGIITGAGFETPAEALYMHKKLMCFPIKGQYEQLCNGAALERFNVPVISSVDESFAYKVKAWLSGTNPKPLTLTNSTCDVVRQVIEKAESVKKENYITYKLSGKGKLHLLHTA
ncbi:MAG TPA: glycosyltransferase family protein [Panacibacter sp.]|nr:glycosyltransferase family protein [Panacibacter sp.]